MLLRTAQNRDEFANYKQKKVTLEEEEEEFKKMYYIANVTDIIFNIAVVFQVIKQKV